jgi:hypothetical protein
MRAAVAKRWRAVDEAGGSIALRGRIVAISLLASAMAVVPAWSEQAQIQRQISGVDTGESPLSAAEAAKQLNDPFGKLVLRKGVFPATVDDVLAALDKLKKPGALPAQASFFISESAHIPVDSASAGLKREFRIVITRTDAANSSIVMMNVPAGDRAGLLELIAWDASKKAFNYYRREDVARWVWRGDSRDALRAASTGQGCFQCHVHGAPVMKELRLPWNNWHSQSASIPREAIPDTAIRDSALFVDKRPAEELERSVRAWASQSISARVAEKATGKKLLEAPRLVRALFETTTVNLTTSNSLSDASATTPLDLPTRFFVNSDLLSTVLKVKIPPFSAKIRRDHYLAAIDKFKFRLEQGSFVRKGDTRFAFLVPEPAMEETSLLQQLVAKNVVTPHFALAVALIDFQNPVFSQARAQLLQYVPDTATLKSGGSDLAEKAASAIITAAATADAGSPEKLFAEHYAMKPEALRAEAEKRLKQYLAAVESRLTQQAGVDDYIQLAETRRASFAQMFLSELGSFPLMLPRTDITSAPRVMQVDGKLGP